MRQEKVALAISIGEEMLKNGGEVYRVDDTIKHILDYYGFKSANVFIISNGIFVTVDENSENPLSCIRNVHNWATDLEKIAELNRLSRDICAGKCSVEEANRQLEVVRNMRPYKSWVEIMATGIGSAAFCYLFGGKLIDMAAAFLIGCLLKLFLIRSTKKELSKFIKHIVGSVLTTIIAVLLHYFINDILVDKVIIGSIMILVPGVALTTSIRDFFSGDYLAGSIHLIDALLTAVCIATGVGVAMKAFMMLGLI